MTRLIDSGDPDAVVATVGSVSPEQMSTLLHEIRNPLTTLQTLAKLLQRRLPSEDNNRWIGDSIAQECRHLQDLLLQFEQDLGSAQTLAITSLSLSDLLRQLEPLYRAMASEHGLDLEIAQDPDGPWVQADPLALRQVLDNLIQNACKYTPAPGLIRLQLHFQPGSEGVDLSISDTGSGIGPEALPRIFDPFFRAHPQGPGQGLGLAISRNLIEQMGGQIWAESQIDHGSTFWIRLPTGGSDHE